MDRVSHRAMACRSSRFWPEPEGILVCRLLRSCPIPVGDEGINRCPNRATDRTTEHLDTLPCRIANASERGCPEGVHLHSYNFLVFLRRDMSHRIKKRLGWRKPFRPGRTARAPYGAGILKVASIALQLLRYRATGERVVNRNPRACNTAGLHTPTLRLHTRLSNADGKQQWLPQSRRKSLTSLRLSGSM